MIRSDLTNKNVLIVVPAFNEASNISQVLNSLKEHNRHILVVNDGSFDATATISRASQVPVLDLAINLGVGGALRAGFQYACRHGFEAVIQVDADGQHSIDHIDNLIAAANHSGADMVVGSRFIDASASMRVGGLRRLTMRVLARSASRATQTKITDSTSGFRLIRQPLLEKFSLLFASNYLGDTYEALIAAGRAGFVVREIPTPIRERLSGSSTSSAIQSSMQTIKVLTVAILQLHTRI
jgi:glycosyltransferase involved in cell wall biosynthesis